MKTKTFLSASRLAVMALACVFTLAFTACGGDEDDEQGSVSELVGLWYNETTNANGETTWKRYFFKSDGTGTFSNSNDLWGDFDYTVTQPGYVSIKMTYYRSGGYYRRETFGMHFQRDGDDLLLDFARYTRVH